MARERLLMDFGWRFHLGHAADPQQDFGVGDYVVTFAKAADAGPVAVLKGDFDDAIWRTLDLPHDWAVELPFEGPDDNQAALSHGFRPVRRNRPANCVGWYRKRFPIAAGDEGKRMTIEFDGVYRDAMVWLNGHWLGRNWSGYSSFHFDVTDYVFYGQDNTLIVRVDASQCEGWFYEGAGIYRHVWLTKTAPVHVGHWGNFVTAEPDRKSLRKLQAAASGVAGYASVTIRTKVENDSDEKAAVRVEAEIIDAAGRRVARGISAARTLGPWAGAEFRHKFTLKKARLWSVDKPQLYKAVTRVRSGSAVTDLTETSFGVRSIRFDKDRGFFLNERPVKLKGVCCHQDHGGVGSALPDAIQAFRIRKLKEMGVNAYRTSHNAPTPELLDECDRQGMLVMDEQRAMGSCPEILSQLDRMILRDRNHPSIVIWSLGNEEQTIQGTVTGRRIGGTMKRLVKNLDATRPVTVAMNNGGAGEGFTKIVDVQGWNYIRIGEIDKWHAEHPELPIVGSEEASTLCTRGIYVRDADRGYVVAYDQEVPGWGVTAETWWRFAAERPWYAGGFIWTGFDYRGEPTPYAWPCINSHFGVIDVCGFPKDNFYYYQAWWTSRPVLHLLPHWNWAGREGQEIDVRALTNCEEVELFVNGLSVGRKAVPSNSHAQWMVRYEPGELLARGYRGGKEILTARVETTGAAAAVRLRPGRAKIKANGEDACLVEAAILDGAGRVVPTADNKVSFEVSENARIIGVCNGDPSSHEPDKCGGTQTALRAERRAFNGLCMVIVQAGRAPGDIKLKAASEGLASDTATINGRRAGQRARL